MFFHLKKNQISEQTGDKRIQGCYICCSPQNGLSQSVFSHEARSRNNIINVLILLLCYSRIKLNTFYQTRLHLLERCTLGCSTFHKGPPPDWMVRYVVPPMKIRCLPKKLDFSVIVLDLAGHFKICIKNGQINTTKNQKILKRP